MPKELSYLLHKDSSFSNDLETETYLNTLFSEVKESEHNRNWLEKNINALKIFFLEFPLLTSFPNSHISVLRNLGDAQLLYSLSTKSSHMDNDSGYLSKIEVANMYILLFILDIKEKTVEEVYDISISLVNDYIRAYKLLPKRHNHDLEELHTSKNKSAIIVPEVTLKDVLKISDKKVLVLHTGIESLVSNQKPFTNIENGLMIHRLVSDTESLLYQPIYRIIRSYDLNCLGEPNLAITMATSAVEGYLIAVEVLIKTNKVGVNYNTCLEETRVKTMHDLVHFACGEGYLSMDDGSYYSTWNELCYKKRNNFLHRQYKFTSNDSRKALDQTALFLIEMNNKITKKYSESIQLLKPISEILEGLVS
jgi:hypothetical protein